MKTNKLIVRVGDTIHFSFKQKTPFTGKGKVIRFFMHNNQRIFEVEGVSSLVFRDEITKVDSK